MRTVLAIFTLTAPLVAQEALSLKQAVDLALRSNPLMAAASAGEKKRKPAFTSPARDICRACSSLRAFSAATTQCSCSLHCSPSTSSAKEISPLAG